MPERNNDRMFLAILDKRLMEMGVDLLDPHREPNELDQAIGNKGNQEEGDPLAQSSEKSSSSLGHAVPDSLTINVQAVL